MHVHTGLSVDGSGTILQACEAACAAGLSAIGFAEHVDFDPLDAGYGAYDDASYSAGIDDARDRWAGRLVVLKGVEIDYQVWFEDQIRAWLPNHRFDYVIGSVHAIEGTTLMSSRYTAGRTADRAYGAYFDAVCDCASSGLFDVIGHLEYAARRGVGIYGPYDPAAHGDSLARAITAVVRCGCLLEVNSAGLRHPSGDLYPTRRTLGHYAELGGAGVVVGSDAHSPSEVALRIATATEAAAECGLAVVVPLPNSAPE